MPWSDYNRWHEKHHVTPEVNIYGAMTMGVPLFLFGTLEHVSWTLTRNPGDRGDCFAVKMVNKRKYMVGSTGRGNACTESLGWCLKA